MPKFRLSLSKTLEIDTDSDDYRDWYAGKLEDVADPANPTEDEQVNAVKDMLDEDFSQVFDDVEAEDVTVQLLPIKK